METRNIREHHLSKVTKALIIILLLLISIYSYCFIKNPTIAYWISSLSVIILIISLLYFFVRKKIRHRRHIKIIETTPEVNARILAVNSDKPGIIILQLLITHPTKDYIASLIIDNTEQNRALNYKAGQNIRVFIDPEDDHHIILPEASQEKNKKTKTSFFITIIIIAVSSASMAPAFISMIAGAFDQSDRKFHDIEIITGKDKQENIWVVRYKSPDKIHISIYDPLTNKKIKTIKEKKEKEMAYSSGFFIVQQDQKVFILGTGDEPLIDVYDAVSFEKLSDISTFEQTNKFFAKGISEIQNVSLYNRFFNDEVFEITTNDGNKCYYNVTCDQFYYSGRALNEVVEKTTDGLLIRRKCVFALSVIPNAVDKHQLFLVKTTDTGRIGALQGLAGADRLDIDYFNKNKDTGYKYCELSALCPDLHFLKGNIIYSDSALVIIRHATTINRDAEVLLSGIDINGKTQFTIKQGEYPNIEKMIEDNIDLADYQGIKIIRHDNKIVFLFGEYGGLSVDVKTGGILWKLEL
ncbi:MAG TPA: hypothetical protein PKN48_03040 [Bacteroidales bacterium]|nr:hypothetical protein [Bacteroidales bacterium]